MKTNQTKHYLLLLIVVCSFACKDKQIEIPAQRYEYANILDISYTPDTTRQCTGWFTDQGAWIGFTIPQKENWVNGFCGPFNIETRQWISRSLVRAGFAESAQSARPEAFTPDSISYFPGELYLSATSASGTISQRLLFVDKSAALLCFSSESNVPYRFINDAMAEGVKCEVDQNTCTFTMPSGEIIALTFLPDSKLKATDNGYEAESNGAGESYAVISFFSNPKEQASELQKASNILENPEQYVQKNNQRWEEYLTKVLRPDMPADYNRIAVKSIVTLLANWRSSRGGLLHDGVVPSHAADYFIGFWAWDSWKNAIALADFAPELAKNQVRAMFDYQLADGMVIDCIYTDTSENNARDSKPPLAAWAVNEIFKATADSAFVKEMYPQLLSYFQWWYANRDHDGNGICEFGSTDGTLEAAAWESGMDNAIRFDNAKMLKNNEKAWSFDQESVDLNAYLAYEYKLLKELAAIAGQPFTEAERTETINTYFFDTEKGFFFDRKLGDGTFIREEGSEAYTPMWAGIATKEQVERSMALLTDTSKFSTYIPFPTVAADNPKFLPKGYWRGPIWLDQTYLAISGLRNYGYNELADTYTRQVFDRLEGLKGSGPIHENYGTHTGEMLKAPHFSWSAAHLLMLYKEYGK